MKIFQLINLIHLFKVYVCILRYFINTFQELSELNYIDHYIL